MNLFKSLSKTTFLSFIAFSASANAFVMEAGEYIKGDLDLKDPVAIYQYQNNGLPSESSYSPDAKINIKFLDSNTVVLSNAGNNNFYPKPIVINLGQNGETNINDTAFKALKTKYADSKFANLVQNISTQVTSRTNDQLYFTVNFDLNLNSNFGIVKNIRLSTDFSLEKFKCKKQISNYIVTPIYTANGAVASYQYKNEIRKSNIDCIKLISFKNTRITDFDTNLDSKLNKAVGFAADIAVQLITSAIHNTEYLLKK